MKFSPSVFDSFTLHSPADGSVTETDFDVPVAICRGPGVCPEECQGKVACEKHVEKQVKCFYPKMHTCLFGFPSVSGSSDGLHNYCVTRLVPKSPSDSYFSFIHEHTRISLILKHKTHTSPPNRKRANNNALPHLHSPSNTSTPTHGKCALCVPAPIQYLLFFCSIHLLRHLAETF